MKHIIIVHSSDLNVSRSIAPPPHVSPEANDECYISLYRFSHESPTLMYTHIIVNICLSIYL